MKCHKCGERVSGDRWWCSECQHRIDRERIWQEAGFNDDDTTPFDPDFDRSTPATTEQKATAGKGGAVDE